MGRLLRLGLALALVVPWAGRAAAWGAEGHRIIAALAYERLTPVARNAVDALIAQSAAQGTPSCPVHSFGDASNWPDCVRTMKGRFAYLSPMHYEDIPICGLPVKAAYCPDGRCVVDETMRALAILHDRRLLAEARVQALEEVSHFIGDMHQPLHAANNGDRGGNEIHVQVSGREENLHAVWDDDVVVAAVGPADAAAEAKLRPLVRAHATAWIKGDPQSWLMEAHRLAVAYVYPRLAQPPSCGQPAPPQALPATYLADAAPLVRTQLAAAAVRLAAVLNVALD